jgi:predicted nucleotide-binding protein (sugar kinase/HSP70/actin superfamily)
LKISVGDLEDLLEFLYQKTGNEKTIRKINLSATDIIGVIDKVDRLIDEKKSKVSIKFTSEELQKITDFINLQLKV